MTAKEVSMELNVPVTEVWSYCCNSNEIHNRPNELDISDFRNISKNFSKIRNGVNTSYRHSYNCA